MMVFKFKINSFVILSISITCYFFPLLFINQLPDYVKQSTLADTIRHKDNLRVAYVCSIFTTIPLIIDILLDIFSNVKNLNYNDRILILLMVIIPAILFIVYHNDDMFPLIFEDLISTQFSVMIHIIISYIVEYSPQTLLPTPIFYMGLMSYYLSNNLQSISILFSSRSAANIVGILSLVFFYLSVAILILITYSWIKYKCELSNNYNSNSNNDMSDFKHHNECFMITSYFSVLWLSLVAYLVASSFSSFGDVHKFNEISCLVYIVHFTVIAAILSVLPGKLCLCL